MGLALPSFKATELTLRQPFIDALNNYIDKAKYNLLTELEYKENGSALKIPDIVILKEGKYRKKNEVYQIDYGGIVAILETKKLDIAKGFAQATQYQTIVRKTFGYPKILGSTNFKKLWVQDNETGNYIISSYNNVNQIAKVVYDSIESGLVTTPNIYTDEDYVNFIQASVNNLTQFTRKIDKKILERLTGTFLATTLDAKICKKKDIMNEIYETSNKAAAFIIVNQLFLYYLLSSGTSALFNPLKDDYSLSDIQKAFDNVQVKDFEAIFNCRLIPLLPEEVEELIHAIIDQFRILKIETRSSDIIGKVFHSLIPFNLRKRIAAYYTGNPAARLLANLTINKADALIADFACGSGTMLVEAYKRKSELFKEEISICERHAKLLSEIYGFDICMFSGHLAAMNLFIQQIECFPEKMNIAIEDSFRITPKTQAVLPIEEKIVIQDFVTKKGRIKLPKHFDAILINPPFTDRRRMTKAYVKFIDRVMEKEGKSKYVQGQFHLGLYFILHCEEFLQNGDFLGVVIPESILQNIASQKIIDFILERFQVYAVISSTAQIAFSENTDWKEVLLILKKASKKERENVRFVTLFEELTYENAKEIAQIIAKGKVPAEYEEKLSIKIVNNSDLEKERNWIRIFRKDKVIAELETVAKNMLEIGKMVWDQT